MSIPDDSHERTVVHVVFGTGAALGLALDRVNWAAAAIESVAGDLTPQTIADAREAAKQIKERAAALERRLQAISAEAS